MPLRAGWKGEIKLKCASIGHPSMDHTLCKPAFNHVNHPQRCKEDIDGGAFNAWVL